MWDPLSSVGPRTKSERKILGYISANVRLLRIAANMTQEELAEAAGVGRAFVYRIEADEGEGVNTSVLMLLRLAKALDVSPQRLLKQAKMPPRLGPGRPRGKGK